MSRALVVLDTEYQRRKAADWCWNLKHGTRVEFKAPKRSDDQNAKMWAMLTEVATQARHHSIKLAPDDWKLLFLDALKREVRMVPNLDGNGIISLGRSSSDLSKQEMSDLIELIFEFGARNGVVFRNPNEPSSSDCPSPEDAAAGEIPEPPAANNTPDSSQERGEEAGDTGAADGQSASSASNLSEEDRAWLKVITKQMWAATGVGEQELLSGTFKGIRDNQTPATISKAARDRGNSIYQKCKLVCFGEKAAADTLPEIALAACCEPKEVLA